MILQIKKYSVFLRINNHVIMKKAPVFIAFLCFILWGQLIAQNEHNVAVIAFYNVENLFDTEKDPNKIDEEFLPNGSYQWTPERYQVKLNNLSRAIAAIGKDKGGAVVLGVSEIENEKVMNDLVSTDILKPLNYGVVHHDSPDRRGVDVAFIYKKDRFRVINKEAFTLTVEGYPDFLTRDQLLMTGILDDTDTLYILVNHWPSKRGGEKRSMPLRIAAAQLSRKIADSLMTVNPNAKVIIMGDLNDNPNAKSVTEYLMAKGKTKEVTPNDLFNPMWKLYRDGIGSYAYRDAWDLLDQIIISYGLLNPKPNTYKYQSVEIFRANFLITKSGSYTGYPFRTYAGGTYQGGYSDHLPVYIVLEK